MRFLVLLVLASLPFSGLSAVFRQYSGISLSTSVLPTNTVQPTLEPREDEATRQVLWLMRQSMLVLSVLMTVFVLLTAVVALKRKEEWKGVY
ncbi:hypothetical protein L596_010575 [Steinernema carpocapsae]|uniref:GOLD domain-containing protein n=1 Tax=Steinernema carpocapsae TaxID=34508 RepID=A0A4U5PK47_STECR|nr:hypothetical protein L596_010575 [Steinernema carpocapsae]